MFGSAFIPKETIMNFGKLFRKIVKIAPIIIAAAPTAIDTVKSVKEVTKRKV
jgi:hypothetical protein